MEVRIIAEGPADKDVIKAIVRKVTGVESENIVAILPSDSMDETDRFFGNFSNWQIVLEKIADLDFWNGAMATVDGDCIIAIHIDTAERGEVGYDINEPIRTGRVTWDHYASELRENVKRKLELLIPDIYRDRIAYAIAIEETEAWIIPMFENARYDTAKHAQPKERLERIIGSDRKWQRQYVNTEKNELDYKKLGKELSRSLSLWRKRNHSLNMFCVELEGLS